MDCDICGMIKNKESFKIIYEDEKIIAALHEAPAFLGHTLIIPKEHYRILEETPDEITAHIFNIANKISTMLFETLNISGTNILVNNGPDAGQTHPHIIVNVIPRTDNDGINLEWPMSQADPNKLEQTYNFLKDFVEKNILNISENQNVIDENEEIITSDEDDYMIKQLKRIP